VKLLVEKGGIKLVLVSINCITFNHEKYIAKAIEGFLSQKVKFQYEILIHDDASTDKTAEIVREYEKKYPEIIKSIYQVENQYSKGIKASLINEKRASGKYIAICEGDDYWIDPHKLQKQVDYMEANPNCTLCFHNAEIINDNGINFNMRLISDKIKSRVFTAGELANLGFIPTASKLYRRSAFENPPDWYRKSIVGDYPNQLIVASHGYAYYIDNVMSVYRSGSFGSSTDRFNKKTVEEKIKYVMGFIEILNNFNEFSNYRYSTHVEQAIIAREVQIIEWNKDLKKLRDIKYVDYLKSMNGVDKLKFFFRMYFREPYMKLARAKNIISLFFSSLRR